GVNSSGIFLNSAEIYNPATGTFTPTGNLNTGRCCYRATLLNNGNVLISAGWGGSDLNSAELYNPTTKSFLPTGNLIRGRSSRHTATLLNNGNVLVVGGANFTHTSTGWVAASIGNPEIYTPLQPNVVTERYDNARTGANLNETVLNPTS